MKLRINVIILILAVLAFFGADAVAVTPALFIAKGVCMLVAAVVVYAILSEYDKLKKQDIEQMNLKMEVMNKALQQLLDMEDGRDERQNKLIETQSSKMNSCMQDNANMLKDVVKALDESGKKQGEAVSDVLKNNADIFTKAVNNYREELNTSLSELKTQLNTSYEQLTSLVKDETSCRERNYDATIKSIKEITADERENITNAYAKLEENVKADRASAFAALEKNVHEVADSAREAQNKNTESIVAVIEKNIEFNEKYLDRIEQLNNIQSNIMDNEEKFTTSAEGMLATFSDAVEEFKSLGEGIKDPINALKTKVAVSLDSFGSKLEQHNTTIEEVLDDTAEDIKAVLDGYGKAQDAAYSKQTESLVETINKLEGVINSQTGEMNKKNTELIDYINKVQDDWTSLNKNEVEFLNRVWNGK